MQGLFLDNFPEERELFSDNFLEELKPLEIVDVFGDGSEKAVLNFI